MKKTMCLSLVLMLSMLYLPAYAEGDLEAGKQKSVICAACHGSDGNSPAPLWPQLAGQHEQYLIRQMQIFKAGSEGGRKTINSTQMYGMVAALSEQDMADIATYFSAQPRKTGVANDELVVRGKAIYRGGNLDTGLPACMACHGPAGEGNAVAGFPAVAGQHAQYSYDQLKAFHAGERTSDPNDMMRELVRKMSDEEMRAVAQYMQGLYSGE